MKTLTLVIATLISTSLFSQDTWKVPAHEKYIDTRYEYADPSGGHLIMENSLPKGGARYTDPNGEEWVYAIFWTRITNQTDEPFELTIEIPRDTIFKLPFSPDNHFRIILPSEKMTVDKAPLFNYGLDDIDAVLINKLQDPTFLQKTINSNETCLFYIITLFKKGVNGTIRTGLSLKDDKLYYRVNGKEILLGRLNNRKLKQQY